MDTTFTPYCLILSYGQLNEKNSLVRFDPLDETFEVFTLPSTEANVRQILGRTGEIWGAESGADKLVVISTNES